MLSSLAACGAASDAEESDDLTAHKCDVAASAKLIESLHDEIQGQVDLTYGPARQRMFDPMSGIDVHDGMIECIYTGRKVKPDGTLSPGGFNTEHTWPQSQGAAQEPARSDLHHIFPVDEAANSARASYPYGYTNCLNKPVPDCTWHAGGSELGTKSSGTGLVFEVRHERRGDVARAQFYFAVRYQLHIDKSVESTLRRWHVLDPPDDTERARNDAIEAVQKNRNPFVDHPELVNQICDF